MGPSLQRPRLLNPQRLRRWLIFGVVLVLVWLIASLAVVYRLTRRRHPILPEPVPVAVRGRYSTHRIATRDGLELGAWFAEGKHDAPSVLLLHGNGGRRWNCLSHAAIWTEAGCAVLLISLRAHGDSTGEFNDLGYSARHDVIAVVDYLEQRRPGRPIIVQGVSMGAAAALFAARGLDRRVCGYILESPYQDLRTAVRNRTEVHLLPVFGSIAYQGLALVAPLILSDVDSISPLRAIEGVPADVPVLILAGGADCLARLEEAQTLHRRVADHGTLIVFERAGHHNLLNANPELYHRSVLGFLGSIPNKVVAEQMARALAP